MKPRGAQACRDIPNDRVYSRKTGVRTLRCPDGPRVGPRRRPFASAAAASDAAELALRLRIEGGESALSSAVWTQFATGKALGCVVSVDGLLISYLTDRKHVGCHPACK